MTHEQEPILSTRCALSLSLSLSHSVSRAVFSMATSKSRVLVVGATGAIGQHIALAGPAQGHPTFALVRPSTLSSKAPLLRSFQAAGISILEGSLEDYESIIAAIKQVDVVISAIRLNELDQLKLIKAIKEVGTIKRFFPSEFGYDNDRVQALEPAKTQLFGPKLQVQKAVEEAGIPYTYVVSNHFAGYFLANLSQPELQSPPRDKVSIYGSGDVEFITVSEEDVGVYTMKAVDDPRTLNKSLHIRPAENILTMNAVVELWEKLIGKTLEKVTVTEEDMVKQIQESPFPKNMYIALLHIVAFQGYQCDFELGPKDVEATTLYPDHKYTSSKEYLARFV